MRNITALAFSIVTACSGCNASANESFYIGALYGNQKISDTDKDYATVGILGGYQYNEFLSIESRYLTGTSNYSRFHSSPNSIYSYKEEIEWQASINLKASFPIYDQFTVYGLIGYTKTRIGYSGLSAYRESNDDRPLLAKAHRYSNKKFEDGLNYGAGISYSLTDTVDVFIEYQALPKDDPQSWNSTSLGVNYRF